MTGGRLTLRRLKEPESAERNGQLLSADASWAEVELTDGGSSIPEDTLVGFETNDTVYIGRVESREDSGNTQRLRVRVDHWLALQDVSSIQKLWSQEQPD